ncbi:hypothetical protein BC937DRAFT_90812 [Endogone sp. FLAS-F59071]|nr:hypothetical protein BC937DRAFT_90812 [Endogone sp. FLAS-F59071]|eukprot:RUS16785.1 hypothetical protein BC937DRAFT_90812 [Endogone sp. FLAS-F59071]
MQASQRTTQTNQADGNRTNQQESLNRRHILTITSGDTFLGRCIAAYLLKESERDGRSRHHECRIRVLCRHDSDCDSLRDMGAEIFVTDYEDCEELREAFCDSEYAIFIPDMSRKRVRHGEAVIKAMEQENVCHVLMMSSLGAETDEKHLKKLHEYRRLEKYLEESLTKGKWCIFRLDFFQQLFMFWAQMIQEEGILALNTGHDGRFAPVNICDICRATYNTVTGRGRRDDRNRAQGYAVGQPSTSMTSDQRTNDSDTFRWAPLDNRHHKKIYRLTGPVAVNGEDIAQMINRVVDNDYDVVRFESISCEEMKKELERIRREHGGRRHDDWRDEDRNDNDRRNENWRYRSSIQTSQGQGNIQTAISGLQAALASVQLASAGLQATVGMQRNENALQAVIGGMQIQTAIAGVQIAVANVQGVTNGTTDGRRGNDRRWDDRRWDDRRQTDEDRSDRSGRRGRNGRNRKHRDGRFRHEKPIGRHLNETKIETIVEFLEFVKSGNADFTSVKRCPN